MREKKTLYLEIERTKKERDREHCGILEKEEEG